MKFEIAVYPYRGLDSIEDVRRLAVEAETLGYDVIAIPDHIACPAAAEEPLGGPYYEACTIAAHLASITSRIRIEFSAIVLPMRNPVQLARELTTLDAISDGRLDVGLALGWLEEEFTSLGEDFKGRGRRFDEYIEVLLNLWSEGPATFKGEYVSYSGVSTNPLPVQRPHPFLWIGSSPPMPGKGVPRSLRRAAKYGDGWMPGGGTLQQLTAGISMLSDELTAVGRVDRIDGFPVFQRLGVWDSGEDVNKHIEDTGGTLSDRLNGDFEKVIDYLGRAAEAGITLTSVELDVSSLSARFESMHEFAERVIGPARGSTAPPPSVQGRLVEHVGR